MLVATFIATTKVVVRFGTVQGATPPLGEAIASHWAAVFVTSNAR